MLILTRELIEDVTFAEIIRQKILRAMGPHDTAVIEFKTTKKEKDEPNVS